MIDDEESMSTEETTGTDDDVLKTTSKTATVKSKRKTTVSALESNTYEASITADKPAIESHRKGRKRSSTTCNDKKTEDLSDKSPTKTPRRTARMSIGNTDITELKKERKKAKAVQKLVKTEGIGNDSDRLNGFEVEMGSGHKRKNAGQSEVTKKGKKTVTGEIGGLDTHVSQKKEKRGIIKVENIFGNISNEHMKSSENISVPVKESAKMQLRKKLSNSVDTSATGELVLNEKKAENKKTKRKIVSEIVEDGTQKKLKKISAKSKSYIVAGSVDFGDTGSEVKAGSSSQLVQGAEEMVPFEKSAGKNTVQMSKIKSKKNERTSESTNQSAVKTEPSAQERLNQRITQRMKEKRKIQS